MARDSTGNYTSPSAPFVSGTTISSSVMNGKLDDLGSEITNSLDRNGKGGMLARLRGVDGTAALPAYSFTDETTLGLWRAGAGDLRAASNGTNIQKWSPTSVVVYQALSAEKGATVTNSTASGAGITSTGGAGGTGVVAAGGTGNSQGVNATGSGNGPGVVAAGGATGVGVQGIGGATSGAGGTFSASGGNSPGLSATGNGTGSGVTATGGATGAGVSGTGGATGGAGGAFVGTGNSAGATTAGNGSGAGLTATGGATGFGVDATGGATTGAAGRFTASGGNSSGVLATGVGSGSGITATGGATGAGVSGTGGATSGVGGTFSASAGNSAGLSATGNGTGVGGTFAAGTAASGGAPAYGVELTNGYLRFNGVTAPSSTTALSNAVTPSNVIKAHAVVALGVSPTITAGFNVTSAAASTDDIVITWATAFADANYTCIPSIQYSPGDLVMPYVKAKTTTTTTIGAVGQSGATTDPSFTLSGLTGSLNVICVGAQ